MRDSGATGTRERRSAAPLREREFRLLFAGRTVSLLGNAIAPVALAFAVLDLTGSKTDLGLILAAREIPLVVFLLAGGVWADRLPRNRVMVGANVVSGLSQATVAALLIVGDAEIWQLAALAAVNGGASAFYFPASGGAPKPCPSRCCRRRTRSQPHRQRDADRRRGGRRLPRGRIRLGDRHRRGCCGLPLGRHDPRGDAAER
ncbi:MAG: MFS transporter, partial [Actinomycetota bacterium]|nr:MFS transporter [Actinomycetota bacterium]